MQFGRNHPRGCSQGSTSPDEGKSHRENTCNSSLGDRAFSTIFLRKMRDAGNASDLEQTGKCCFCAQKLAEIQIQHK